LQQGHPTGYGGANQYQPFCYLRLRDPMPVAQRIEPEVMTVESVWLDTTTVSIEQPLHLASTMLAFGGDRSPVAYQFRISLKSGLSPGIRLVCSGAFDVPVFARPIRPDEMRVVLGDYISVRVMAR